MKKRAKILIVEDEKALHDALLIKLKGAGFILLESYNGKEGLEMALKEHPDVILLDIAMPVMGGIEALKKLREDEWGKTAKVIILTNLSNDMDKIKQVMENEVFTYLVKSDTEIAKVVEKIKEMVH